MLKEKSNMTQVIVYAEGFLTVVEDGDRLSSLVVRVPGYRSRGPYSIPGATRFSEK
jgi:hypothetical protein